MRYSILGQVDDQFRCKQMCQSRLSRLKGHRENFPVINWKQYRIDLVVLKEWIFRLDNNHIIPTRNFIKRFGTTEEHCKLIFGTYRKKKKFSEANTPMEKIEEHMFKKLQEATLKARKQELEFKLETELRYGYNKDCYVVFNSLTCRPETIDKVFAKRSRPWERYKTFWDRNAINHKYFAVVEKGDKHGRLHIHVVHIFDDFKPGTMVDPNRNISIPYRREITGLKKLWKEGHSTPIAVRYGPLDRYGKEGWRWPVVLDEKTKEYKPYDAKGPKALARYMMKYVNKSYEKKDEMIWRTRMKREFGTMTIKLFVSMVKSTYLFRMIKTKYRLQLTIKNSETKIPPNLLEKEVTKELLRRIKKRHPKMIPLLLTAIKPAPSYQQQLKTSILQSQEYNLQNTGHIKTKSLKNTDIFELTFIYENVTDYLFYKKDTLVNGTTRRNL